nr:tRNA (adenosine(37)-N6)-dimethylallyltransferase MiaA [Methyloferula stellata]
MSMPDLTGNEWSLDRIEAVLIAGPTASGKSALALDLALRHNGALINTDSMQVYRDLHVLSARPTQDEESQVPHFLFGHVDGAVNYSVGHWLEDVARVLPAIRQTGRLPIFVGGTGLYFKALTQGLSDIPRVPQAVRLKIRAEAEGVAPALLHERLMACDPVMAARLRPSDPQRLLRALEVFAATGQSLASFQHRKSAPFLDIGRCEALFLAPDRGLLRKRIAMRFELMLKLGALEEVERLVARSLDPALPVMRAHGVPHLLRYLRGDIDLATAATFGIMDTQHYAKRQFTFARHQLPAFRMCSVENMPLSRVQ